MLAIHVSLSPFSSLYQIHSGGLQLLVHFTCHFWDPLVYLQCHFGFTLRQILVGRLEIIQNTSRGILKSCHSDCRCVTEICHIKSYLLNFNLEVSELRSSSSSTIVGNSNKSTNPSKVFNKGLEIDKDSNSWIECFTSSLPPPTDNDRKMVMLQ